ncbi:hypothetical protein I6H67_03930 [Pediococcus pentosaceus]|uniref:hypothetical protein n=1 Tax=Pediococcus pentosaceus TaxID=1255 RepID=UPI000C06A43C|nr:hypothetical protein [Pediococcus pentosaceus]MBF7104595.1 hypothetical protein [Pediococcus pentosaceus]QQC62009.1 hypothetical protein I6H67_03930 [Pediococcus pentosaceus]
MMQPSKLIYLINFAKDQKSDITFEIDGAFISGTPMLDESDFPGYAALKSINELYHSEKNKFLKSSEISDDPENSDIPSERSLFIKDVTITPIGLGSTSETPIMLISLSHISGAMLGRMVKSDQNFDLNDQK